MLFNIDFWGKGGEGGGVVSLIYIHDCTSETFLDPTLVAVVHYNVVFKVDASMLNHPPNSECIDYNNKNRPNL